LKEWKVKFSYHKFIKNYLDNLNISVQYTKNINNKFSGKTSNINNKNYGNPNMSQMSNNTIFNDDPYAIRKCHNHPKRYSKILILKVII
jgi:hypothetical protein